MKFRGLTVAVVVLAALTGALYWSNHRKPAQDALKASADTPPKILTLNEAEIAKIGLKKKGADEVVLVKQDSGQWQMSTPGPFGVDSDAVSGVVSTLSSLSSERLIEDKASDLKPYGLSEPSLEVDIAKKDGKTLELLLGDETPTGSAVYAMLGGDPRVFTVASYTKSSIDKTAKDLRDKRLLTIEADKIVRVELIAKKQDIEFGRNKDEWQILKPRPLRADGMQVEDLVRKLKDAKMDLTVSDQDEKKAASAFASGTPVATAKVTAQSGTQELELRKNKEDYYAKSSLVGGVHKVSSDLGQGLDKSLDDFRQKKLFDFGFQDPNKIEMHDGAKANFLSRNGEDWWSNGKKMDLASVESFVEKIRDLSARKLVDSGFSSPVIDIAVTSGDGKRVEKVFLSKNGSDYVAKRENDLTLYELDSSAVEALAKSAAEVKPAAPPTK